MKPVSFLLSVSAFASAAHAQTLMLTAVTTQPTPVCQVSNEIKQDGQGINVVEFSDLNKQDDRVAIDFEYELGNNTMYCVKFDSLGNMKARKCYGDDGLPECLKNVCNGGKCLVKADGTEKCINCPSGFSGEFCSTPYSGSQCASLELLNPPETDRQFSTVKRLAKLEDGSTHRTMSWIDSPAGWFPDWTGTGSSLRHQWITIDLKSDMSIVGIAIQGSSDTYAAGTGWVSSFTVEYRIDGGSEDRQIYDYGIQKVFRNYPKFSSYGQYASVLFDEAVVGRYITIRTVSIEIYPAMRVGLLKCSD